MKTIKRLSALFAVIMIFVLSQSAKAQVVEDTTRRETLTKISLGVNSHVSLRTINGEYYLHYRNREYLYYDDYKSLFIGDLDSYNSLRKAVLDGFNLDKYGEKRFTFNNKYFIVQKVSRREVAVFIFEDNIRTSIGYWNSNYINKLLPVIN